LKEIEDVDIYMLGVLLLLLGMVGGSGVMQVKMEEIEVWRASASTTI
jgi:hypothetical protein